MYRICHLIFSVIVFLSWAIPLCLIFRVYVHERIAASIIVLALTIWSALWWIVITTDKGDSRWKSV